MDHTGSCSPECNRTFFGCHHRFKPLLCCLLTLLASLSMVTLFGFGHKDVINPLLVGQVGGEKVNAVESHGSLSWGLERISARDAWSEGIRGERVVVAVIDSGIQLSHPQLHRALWKNSKEIPNNNLDDDHNGYIDDYNGWDFCEGVPPAVRDTPLHWHGTFVAGIIASLDLGVAPNAKLMDLRVAESTGQICDWQSVRNAIDYAVDNGAKIINISFSFFNRPPDSVVESIERAKDKGVFIVGIAGNEGGEVSYPGKLPTVLTVSAIDKSSHLSSFSNWGPEVDLAGPGMKVTSIVPEGDLGVSSGTSFAAAYVTGTVALLIAAKPSLSYQEIVSILYESALDIGDRGKDKQFGWGLVNAGQAVRLSLL